MPFALRRTPGLGGLAFLTERTISLAMTAPTERDQVFTADVVHVAGIAVLPSSLAIGKWCADMVDRQVVTGGMAPFAGPFSEATNDERYFFPGTWVLQCRDVIHEILPFVSIVYSIQVDKNGLDMNYYA